MTDRRRHRRGDAIRSDFAPLSISPLRTPHDKAERLNCCNIAISNNVGSVKQLLSTQLRALEEERHFALVVGLRFPTWARFNRSGQELSPTQPSLRSLTAIMITCSNSPALGSGMPNHYVGDLLHTIGDVRALPRANRAFAIGRSRSPDATSSTDARPTFAPSLLSRSFFHAASKRTAMRLPSNAQSSLISRYFNSFVHFRERKAMMSCLPFTNSERFLQRESRA